MNEKYRQIFDTLAKGAGTAISNVGQFARECKEQATFMEAQRAEAYRQYERAQFCQKKLFDYQNFTDILKQCLQRNHAQCGLTCPECPEELFCDTLDYNIDGNEVNPIFRHEVERVPIGANVHTISQRTVKKIPAADIEKRLLTQLPKYAGTRGYSFTSLSVTDIPGGKIRIETQGVFRCLPITQSPNWGAMIW